jgi:integrase
VKNSDVGESQGHPVLAVRQKGGNSILHRLHLKLAEYIEMYRNEFMGDDGYLFTGLSTNGSGRTDKPVSPQAINWIVSHWAEVAGITQHVTPHVGRATVITEALKRAPLQVVSIAIGHASPETTARYDRSRDRMERAIVNYQDVQF